MQILLFVINNSCIMSNPHMLLDRPASAESLDFKFVKVVRDGRVLPVPPENRELMYSCYRLMHESFLTMDKVLSGVPIPDLLPIGSDFVTPTFNIRGGTLFPERGPPTRTDVILCCIVLKRDVVATCLLTLTNGRDAPAEGVGVEIWSVASNPAFKRTGGVKYLFYNIFSKLTDMMGGTLPVIRLTVAKDSYPYINFYDRLLLYGKLGFTMYSGSVLIYNTSGEQISKFTKQDVKFVSPLYTGAPDLQLRTSDRQIRTLSDLKRDFPIGFPGPETVVMTTIKVPMIPRLITETMEQIREKGFELSPIPRDLPSVQWGFLSHSAYIQTPSQSGIKMAVVPENFELVIFNSPGSVTNLSEVSSNWNFVQKYLSSIPIGYLKLLCPGFKPSKGQGVILDKDYLISTGESPVFYVGAPNRPSPYLYQIHSYNAGDLFPEHELSGIIGPRSTDFVGLMFGAYQFPARWVRPMPRRADLGQYADLSSPNMEVAFSYGSPDLDKKYLPRDMPPIPPGGFINYTKTLSSIISNLALNPGPTKRLYIFSCAILSGMAPDDPVNNFVRNLSTRRMTRHITLQKDQYSTFLQQYGQAIQKAFGRRFGGLHRRTTMKNKRNRNRTIKRS